MARPDEPNKATTDFFILLKEAPYLDGKFAAFGRVTKGIEVVETINKAPVTGEKPEKPVRIRRATVTLCGDKGHLNRGDAEAQRTFISFSLRLSVSAVKL